MRTIQLSGVIAVLTFGGFAIGATTAVGCIDEWQEVASSPIEVPPIARTAKASAKPTVAEIASAPPPASSFADDGWMPPPLDGGRVITKSVELQLPRGCQPLPADAFVRVAAKVDDDEAQLMMACNIAEGGRARATMVMIRHRIQMETGELAAKGMRRAGAVISATATTAGPAMGQALGPEVVESISRPSFAGGRPSTSVFFGAQDGLYVLYAEVDAEMSQLPMWADALAASMRPTASAQPIRWRAPVGLAPSSTAIGGPHRMRLPEGVHGVAHTLGDVVGVRDPLDPHDAHAMAMLRDDTGVSVGGTTVRAKLLAPFATTPGELVHRMAQARGARDLQEHGVSASVGVVARVDGTRDEDGAHEIYAAFQDSGDEVVVVHLVFDKDRWAAYAPFIDASLATIEAGEVEGAY